MTTILNGKFHQAVGETRHDKIDIGEIENLPIMVGIGFDRKDKELDMGFLGRRKKEKYIVFRSYMNNSH